MVADCKYFTICDGDVGTEAYHDRYVHDLQAEVERLKKQKADLNATMCLQRRRNEQLDEEVGRLSRCVYGSGTATTK